MRLFDIFSDNALFQASSTLTLRGTAEPGTNIFARLIGYDASTHGRGICSSEGIFEVTIDTPSASYNKYEIEVTDGECSIVLKNILFGELWIASGQSNMELEISKMFEGESFLENLKNLDIRAFSQENGSSEVFSTAPENETKGRWVSTSNPSSFSFVSACATSFCKYISDNFNKIQRNTPIGFLNVSWGGTPIYSWIPQEAIVSCAVVNENLKNRKLLPVSCDCATFEHPSVMFNRKIAPIRGIKARGMLWYQGEYDSFSEFKEHIYKDLLNVLHDSYAELFAYNREDFRIISSLIYPCNYTDTGDTNVGYLNDAFVKAALESPDIYTCVPIYDLPPSWWPLDSNHPIHPLHKYALGERMAMIALRNIYGFEGQKCPAILRSSRIEDNRFILTFNKTDNGLYTNDGKHVRGMYIAGKDSVYMPADCEILSDCEIAVFHPYLKEPCSCLYGWSSYEVNLNLFCGDFPILPFATDKDSSELIKVELKNFLNPEVQSELEWFEDSMHSGEWYYRPVWRPLEGSNVCADNAFTLRSEGYGVSLSVDSFNDRFGIYTVSHSGHAFDFENYSSLEIDIFHCGKLSFEVVLKYSDDREIKICARYTGKSPMYFNHYSVDFSNIPNGVIKQMSYVFNVNNEKILKHINIGRMYLCPKN